MVIARLVEVEFTEVVYGQLSDNKCSLLLVIWVTSGILFRGSGYLVTDYM